MCGDCFVCIYLVCQCDGLELGRRNRRITVRGVTVRINTKHFDIELPILTSCFVQLNQWHDPVSTISQHTDHTSLLNAKSPLERPHVMCAYNT